MCDLHDACIVFIEAYAKKSNIADAFMASRAGFGEDKHHIEHALCLMIRFLDAHFFRTC